MKRKLMLLLACLFVGIGLATAQTQTVTGVVISEEDGQPVIGASVVVKGTQLGTITGMDGDFTIPNVPSSAKTLVISFIGMQTQEVAVAANVKITMKSDMEVLDEVIVTAYGTAKKSAFTGSASVIKSEEIAKVQATDATQALVGKVAGVQINNLSGQPGKETASIRIRGISSINAGKEPLIILDGVPYDGDMNNINSQDIESMTVLKDAASNALYGARGANGVIIITTKKGDKGQAKVTVDAKWGANTRATVNHKYITDPGQYYEMWYGALKSYFVNAQNMTDAAAHLAANQNLTANNAYGLGYNVYSVPVGQSLIGTNGRLNPNATLGNVVNYDGQDYLLLPDDWTDAAYKTGIRQEYTVTASGGSDKSTFYASFNYLKNEGISENTSYDRITARLRADYQIKEWLKVGANVGFAHYDGNDLGDDGESASSGNIFTLTKMAPIYPLYIRDGQGNILKDNNGITRYDYGDGKNAGAQRPYMGQSNALSDNILNVSNYEGNSMSMVGFAEIRFLKDFKFTSTNSVYVDETRATSVTNPFYGLYASSNGILGKQHARGLAYNYQQLLNWSHVYGKHNVEAMIGHETYNYKSYSLYGGKSNMFDPTNPELDGAVIDGSTSSATSYYNTEGYFARMQYDFDEKYFGSASFRRDASSRFHPDNRWGNFWSFGGAWMISKEDFFDVEWIDELKIKASYGEQGNDGIGDYRYTNTFSIVNSNGNPAAVPATRGNKDITWETNANFNAGVDFKLFDGRLSGTVEYFKRKTTDMLFSFPLPPTFGYTSYYANVGDMENNGIELELNATIFDTKDFKWDVNFNMTHYKTEVTYLPEERKTMTVDGYEGYIYNSDYFVAEGLSMYNIYTYKYAGVDSETGKALYYYNKKDDANENIIGLDTTDDLAKADQYLCGTSLPDFYGGFGTSLEYKGIDLSATFSYQIGGQSYDSDYAAAMGVNKGSAFHADLLNAWTPENPNTDVPRFQYNDSYTASMSDRFLTDASYLSLQNVTLGYTLPSRWCKKMGLEKLRIYGTADNVWVWSKRQGLDPRQSITGSASSAYYAPMRTVSGGITLTF